MAALLYLFLHPISRLIHLKWGVLQEPRLYEITDRIKRVKLIVFGTYKRP